MADALAQIDANAPRSEDQMVDTTAGRPFEKFASMANTATSLLSAFNSGEYCRFRDLRGNYSQLCMQFDSDAASGPASASLTDTSTYDWSDWRNTIRAAFSPNLPFAFLWNPTISGTMVAGGFGQRTAALACIDIVRRALGEDALLRIAREDFVGVPKIVNSTYRTSFNRIYHCSHLAHYVHRIKRKFPAGNSVLEWGGGYGDMARILRRLSPDLTYILVDLPEMLALQYIYLGSLEGTHALNVVSPDTPVADGKINFVPVGLLRSGAVSVRTDAFLSTWALTESPPTDQELVLANDLFAADQILLAYSLDSNNRLVTDLRTAGCVQKAVPTVDQRSEYSFR